MPRTAGTEAQRGYVPRAIAGAGPASGPGDAGAGGRIRPAAGAGRRLRTPASYGRTRPSGPAQPSRSEGADRAARDPDLRPRASGTTPAQAASPAARGRIQQEGEGPLRMRGAFAWDPARGTARAGRYRITL
jgi:hypothetical protein